MRPEPLSTCERRFIIDGLLSDQRFDRRSRDDFREVKLVVGTECGSAICTIGATKVLCAVSAQIAPPSRSRPNQGLLYVEVDMSPMGDPANEHNRLGERGMELTRLLELVLRDSRCVDLEALCIRAEQEVWKLRLDVRVLDDDGSLFDVSSIAAVTALYHFRRPNVTVQAHHTIIHSAWEKALIPLNIYHMPICVTFGVIDNSDLILVDPTSKEQKCLSGGIVIACNKRREVCALHQSTSVMLSQSTIDTCIRRAMQRAVDISELVSTVIKDDFTKRAKYEKPPGFETTVNADLLTCRECQPNELLAPAIKLPISVAELHKTQDSVVLNENPLTGGSKEYKIEMDEDKAISGQVDHIVSAVDTVQISKKQSQAEKDFDQEGRDLIAEIEEDLMGETQELLPETQDDGDVEVDMMAARKKKK